MPELEPECIFTISMINKVHIRHRGSPHMIWIYCVWFALMYNYSIYTVLVFVPSFYFFSGCLPSMKIVFARVRSIDDDFRFQLMANSAGKHKYLIRKRLLFGALFSTYYIYYIFNSRTPAKGKKNYATNYEMR